jgi:IgA Peptidase M64
MAKDIILDPSCDLYLTRSTVSASQLRLSVYARIPDNASLSETYVVEDVTRQCEYDIYPLTGRLIELRFPTSPNNVVIVRPRGSGVGENYIQVRFRDRQNPALYHYLIARVQVFNQISSWWFGNTSLTVPRHDVMMHAQASAYALFDADARGRGHLGDITGHGYVQLQSSNPAVCELDSEDRGRMRGRAVGSARLQGNFLGHREDIAVNVTDFYGQAPNPAQPDDLRIPLVENHIHNGHPDRKQNMLFIAEGFTNRSTFDYAVTDLTDRLFRAPRHSPYHLLRTSFNVWKVFQPAAEAGITYGPTCMGWQLNITQLPDVEILFSARDTLLGLCYGARNGERKSAPHDFAHLVNETSPDFRRRIDEFDNPPAAEAERMSDEGVWPDPRRYPREMDASSLIRRYIGALAVSPTERHHPNLHLGRYWMPNPRSFVKDYGLVCILVNDKDFRQANYGPYIICSISSTREVTASVLSNPERAPHVWRVRRNPSVTINIDYTTDIVAHELSHSFNLGDEYESRTETIMFSFMNTDNLQTINEIRFGPADLSRRPSIDASKLKWSKLHRIAFADPIASGAQWERATSQVTVRLDVDAQRLRLWDTWRLTHERVFLRQYRAPVWGGELGGYWQLPHTADINPMSPETEWVIIENMLISRVDMATGQIVLTVPSFPASPPPLPTGSLLYIPKMDCDGTTPLKLVEPEINGYMTRERSALSNNFDARRPGRCAPEDNSPDLPPAAAISPANSSRCSFPANSFLVIGAYEGGWEVSCGAYRSAGACKMRLHTAGGSEGVLCFVCQYLIVNRVNPSLHGVLDQVSYPRVCRCQEVRS